MNELKATLMGQARGKGICAAGYEEMRVGDFDALVDYYLANPDWCMERDFPSLGTLKEHFSAIEDKGVFVDKTFDGEVLDDLQVYVFHHCKGTVKVGLNVNKAIIPMLYVGNGSRLRFVGVGDYAPKDPQDRSIVPIYTFGKSDVSAHSNKYVWFIKNKPKQLKDDKQ